MEKAQLKLYDPNPGRRLIRGAGGSIPFQFNPKEVTIAKAAKWERKTAKGAKTAGPPEFSGSEPCKLTLEMFFDASGNQDGSVVAAVEKLFSCTVPTEESVGQKKPSPPLVVLHWGAIASFPAFITSVSAKYTLFSAGGLPIRALCSRGPRGDAQRALAGRTRRREARTSGGHTCSSPGTPSRPWPTRSTATRAPGGPSRGSTASTTRCVADPACGCCCPHPRSWLSRCPTPTPSSSRSTARHSPADIVPLLISAYVDDSQQYPDLFELRFRDPGHIVLPKSAAKVGSKVKISVMTSTGNTPAAADDR